MTRDLENLYSTVRTLISGAAREDCDRIILHSSTSTGAPTGWRRAMCAVRHVYDEQCALLLARSLPENQQRQLDRALLFLLEGSVRFHYAACSRLDVDN